MPSGCTVFVDEQKPENCRVNFDAESYDRNEIRLMFDGYLRLLEDAAEHPEWPLGKLLMIMRWDAAIAEIAAGTDAMPVDSPLQGGEPRHRG